MLEWGGCYTSQTYQSTPVLHIVQVSVSMSTEVEAGSDPWEWATFLQPQATLGGSVFILDLERQDRFHWVLQDTECTRNALLWQRAGLPHILEVTTNTFWRQIKLQQFDGHFVSMLHSSLLCSLVPSVSGVIVKLANNTLVYYSWFSARGWCFCMTNVVHGFRDWHRESDMFV